MKYYKLTDQDMQTRGSFQWEIGKWIKATGASNQPLCTNGWLHCYDSPLLAVLHNPIHANVKNPRLFEIEGKGKTKSDGLKRGFREIRLVKEIPLPEITLTQKVAYGILCAKKVYKNKDFQQWADNWLSDKDRTRITAKATADAAWTAADAATNAVWAAAGAADAAKAAAKVATQAAADAAARAADAAADAAWAADAATDAAWAAAWAAARAAGAAADAATEIKIGLDKLAQKAMEY